MLYTGKNQSIYKKELIQTATGGSSVRDEHSPRKHAPIEHAPIIPPSEFTENPSNYMTARSQGSKVSVERMTSQ